MEKMSPEDMTDAYIAYDNRLASFQKTTKKRGTGSAGKGNKVLNWPHKSLAPEKLARAGLFFNPTPENPDNVTCFLCHKALDGWEANDDPLIEHLKHAPECGWAIVAAIEAELGSYALEDPNEPWIKNARKATFAERWPHDGKKGWKCKTKQLVDAGWKYTPTEEYDDMATCVYCQLALDGWESSDKPLDEHYKRSPNCAFFTLVEEAKTAKKSKTKSARTSKASRLSVQSIVTAATENTSMTDMSTAPEDSILTTASATQGGKKGRAKKATVPKTKKGKAKKEEIPATEEAETPKEDEAPPKPARGRKRGSVAVDDPTLAATEAPAPKKRATRKKDNTTGNDSLHEGHDDSGMTDAPAPKKTAGRKKAATATRNTSNTSAISQASSASLASLRAPPVDFPDDDEIERQLEADLERPLSDDDEITADSDSERIKAQSRLSISSRISKKDAASRKSTDYAMFDPAPVEPDEEEVEDELKALQAEMQVDEPEPLVRSPEPEPESEPEIQLPKRSSKEGTQKATKQTKTKKAKATPEVVNEKESRYSEELDAVVNLGPKTEPLAKEQAMDDSIVSTGSVAKKAAPARSSTGKRRGRPSKVSLAAQEAIEASMISVVSADTPVEEEKVSGPQLEVPVKRGRGRPSKTSLASRKSLTTDEVKDEAPIEEEPAPKRGRGRPSKMTIDEMKNEAPIDEEPAPKRGRGRPSKKSLEARKSMEKQRKSEPSAKEEDELAGAPGSIEEPALSTSSHEKPAPEVPDENSSRPGTSSSNHLPAMPSTPRDTVSPAPSARQAAVSPSPSPQSSNAENDPLSSKANTSTELRSANLSATTPNQSSSPSKRTVVSGLQTEMPWNPVDLDSVFGSPHKYSEKAGVDRLLKKGPNLTSPEKQMTVEEWIKHNAEEAERKLKDECETMVSRFESEGGKAMHALEGLAAE